ncbi:hypothetical protein DFQ28_007406 [Apophysomyces sp. BC1034]|nr:hypothetical protein DFQ30_007309 [Apophysomyces sp. BC1015]KAG0176291.1 hypothetical protein DFQ29_006312 [Apophysomyces sp. BC1021]KAG0186714.1 hypothetical protein DFQ28_007406 [Apophysomyces sp. BC1034]
MNNDTSTTTIKTSGNPIPTTTLGPLTIGLIVVLALVTCMILHCGRIRRQVFERRLVRKARAKDLEWTGNSQYATMETYDTKTSPGRQPSMTLEHAPNPVLPQQALTTNTTRISYGKTYDPGMVAFTPG